MQRSGFLQAGYKKWLYIADLVADHPEFIAGFLLEARPWEGG